MTTNPFDEIVLRLQRIESLLINQPSPSIPVQEAEYLTRDEAASMLSISTKTLGEWTKEGTVKGYRIGTRIRYKKNELQASLIQIRTR